MKILLAVDGSSYALDAVNYLVGHLDWAREKPQVELVYVHPPVPQVSGLSRVIGKKQLQRYYEEEGAEALAPAKRILDKAKIAYAEKVLVGSPAETLVAHAKAASSDLLLIGHRGMNAAANLMLGSVATKILHLSPVPVLLVK